MPNSIRDKAAGLIALRLSSMVLHRTAEEDAHAIAVPREGNPCAKRRATTLRKTAPTPNTRNFAQNLAPQKHSQPMSTLERAIAIAAESHAGQRDKGGAPYILHPIRVMLRLQSETDQIVGVLHDVVEDSEWTLDRLRAEGFQSEVLRAVGQLTRRNDESYEEFVRRASTNAIAARVKVADLEENMDLSRISEPTEKDRTRLLRYERALAFLRSESHGA